MDEKRFKKDAQNGMIKVMNNAPQPTLPTPENPYGFILNPNKDEKRSSKPLNKGINKKLLAVGSGVILILLISILWSAFSGSSKSQEQRLLDLLSKQQEVVRISELVKKDDTLTQETKNWVSTISLTTSSEQEQLKAYLSSKSITIDKAVYDKSKNTKTDKSLTDAKQNNSFELTAKELLAGQLKSYRSDVQNAYNNASNEKSKTMLKGFFDSLTILIGD